MLDDIYIICGEDVIIIISIVDQQQGNLIFDILLYLINDRLVCTGIEYQKNSLHERLCLSIVISGIKKL